MSEVLLTEGGGELLTHPNGNEPMILDCCSDPLSLV